MKPPKDREFTNEDLEKMGIYIHPSELESDILEEDVKEIGVLSSSNGNLI